MAKILVLNSKDDVKIGSYESSIVPRAGEFIDANDGHWAVLSVQHDIRGALKSDNNAFQSVVVVYVSEVK
jgi:hypothetical protein